MDIDALTLARLQFAFTIGFHIIFPAFTIGLATFLAVLEASGSSPRRRESISTSLGQNLRAVVRHGCRLRRRHVLPVRHELECFLAQAGHVIGPLLGYEVLTAFFLEASFLGIMLFGLKRVGPRLHFSPR